jgi:hypothetical protein
MLSAGIIHWALRPRPFRQAKRVFAKHGGMLRTSEAVRYGVHPRVLYELRDRLEQRATQKIGRLVEGYLGRSEQWNDRHKE